MLHRQDNVVVCNGSDYFLLLQQGLSFPFARDQGEGGELRLYCPANTREQKELLLLLQNVDVNPRSLHRHH